MNQDKHNDAVDEHWQAVCHHAETVMFDEGSPFAYLLGENVRSIPSSLVPEPSTAEWEAAGFTIESPKLATIGTGTFPRLEDRAHTKKRKG